MQWAGSAAEGVRVRVSNAGAMIGNNKESPKTI
eukprot:COSAG06_NODE_65870_length_256_cov_0.407643_1_plen_32_part_01